jgi:hypothetical protein
MKVAIVNDCTIHHHFGCDLVMEAYRHLLAKNGHEVIHVVKNGGTHGQWPDVLRKPEIRPLGDADLVIVNAEGSMHDDHHPNMLRIAQHFPCVLMNGVFQRNTKALGCIEHFLAVAMRESLSAAEVERVSGVKCEIVPDVVLLAPTLVEFTRLEPWMGNSATDSSADKHGEELTPFVPPPIFLMLLIRHTAVACGRFHAALCCARLGIPFSVYPANTWKNRGLMLDMGLQHLYCETKQDAMERIPEEFPDNARRYVERAIPKIESWFQKLGELV